MQTLSYEKHNTLHDLVKAGAHVVLGLLPEQEKLEQKISWYDADYGVEISSGVEILVGVGGAITAGDPLSRLLYSGAAVEAIFFRFGSMKSNNPETYERWGSLYLELPYRALKSVFKNK